MIVTILIVAVLVFLYIIVTKPNSVGLNKGIFKTEKKPYTIDDEYNEMKVNKAKEIDAILEKIHKKGIDSLTAKEKQALEENSKK